MRDKNKNALRVSFIGDPMLTKQSMRDECDINQIMARHARTGVIEHVNKNEPQYGDYSNVTDYQSALQQVQHAEETFAALPAHIRDRMQNNPSNLVAFMDDDDNIEESIALGLRPTPLEASTKREREESSPVTETGEKTPASPVAGGE